MAGPGCRLRRQADAPAEVCRRDPGARRGGYAQFQHGTFRCSPGDGHGRPLPQRSIAPVLGPCLAVLGAWTCITPPRSVFSAVFLGALATVLLRWATVRAPGRAPHAAIRHLLRAPTQAKAWCEMLIAAPAGAGGNSTHSRLLSPHSTASDSYSRSTRPVPEVIVVQQNTSLSNHRLAGGAMARRRRHPRVNRLPRFDCSLRGRSSIRAGLTRQGVHRGLRVIARRKSAFAERWIRSRVALLRQPLLS